MKVILVAALATLAVGCVSNQNDLSADFGASVITNMEANIIDPTPTAGAPEGDGPMADAAIVRYRTDKVKKPVTGSMKPTTQAGSPPSN
jgi:hypothetical protein